MDAALLQDGQWPIQALFRGKVAGWDPALGRFACSCLWNDRQDWQKVSVHSSHRSVCAEQRAVPQSWHFALAERPHVAPKASSRLRTSNTPQ